MVSDAAKAITILMADDDEDDRLMTKDALEEARLSNDLRFVEDGEELMDYLYQRGKYNDNSNAPKPGLILLDLNMPGIGGKEFLRKIKDDDSLKQIPVVILTTSNSERDIIDSYKLQASGYINKPLSIDELTKIMEQLETYWFVICKRLPRGS